MPKLSQVKHSAFHAHTHWAKQAPTRALWVRHGETDWNVQRRIQGWRGVGLNKLGMRQARETASRLARNDVKPKVVVCSDLLRARQTAEIIALKLKLKLVILPELRERAFGDWEGLTIDEVLARYKLNSKARRDPFLSFNPTGGESMLVFAKRMDRALNMIEQRWFAKDLIVVSHGGPMRIAACRVLGVPPKLYYLLGRPGNSALTLISSQGGVRWLEYYNDTAHLEKKRP